MNTLNYRIGQGWDRHPLVTGRPCVLGGVCFPDCPVGPKGHSDGDAVIHAVIDALCGASGMGDIGCLFPDTDQKWAGANSLDLLAKSWNLVKEKGFRIQNIDCTIITEQPKIAPRSDEMRRQMAEVLELSPDQVSIKATRGEKLGPEGRGECVTAMAITLLSFEEPN